MQTTNQDHGIIPEVTNMTREFRQVMGQELDPDVQGWLVVEEVQEVIEALNSFLDEDVETVETVGALLKELGDYLYVSVPYVEAIEAFGPDAIEKSPELHETVFEGMRIAAIIGEELSQTMVPDDLIVRVVREIHGSNISKLDDEGLPIFNEDGKVTKGPNYAPPDMSEFAKEALDNLADYRASVEMQETVNAD